MSRNPASYFLMSDEAKAQEKESLFTQVRRQSQERREEADRRSAARRASDLAEIDRQLAARKAPEHPRPVAGDALDDDQDDDGESIKDQPA
jgi:hypothetical protein